MTFIGKRAEELAADLPLEIELRAGVTSLTRAILLVRGLAHDAARLRQMRMDCWARLRPQVLVFPPNVFDFGQREIIDI